MNANLKKVNKTIEKLKKQGYDTNFLLRDKTPEEFARNKTSMKQFDKRVKVTKERVQIAKTEEKRLEKIVKRKAKELQKEKTKLKAFENSKAKNVDKKIAKATKKIDELTREVNRGLIKPETLHHAKFDMEMTKITRKDLTETTANYINKFLNRYFKNAPYEEIKRIKKDLTSRFGVRLDLAQDFIEQVTSMAFNYEVDGIVFDKGQFKNQYGYKWEETMENRAKAMQDLLNTKKYMI